MKADFFFSNFQEKKEIMSQQIPRKNIQLFIAKGDNLFSCSEGSFGLAV